SDYFDERGCFYLVMDYIEGETPEQRLLRSPEGLPQETIVEMAIQLCDVLEYLHSQTPPVIFRDMKPANVMLTPEGDVKLIDFGVARLFDPTKRTDTLKMGTAGYAPPEQYAGQGQTTPRSDVYALGVTLYELLTSDDPTAHPFVFTPPRQLNSAISPSLADVVMRAVKMDPDDRFPSITAMRDALQKTTRPRRFRLPSIQRKSGSGTKIMPQTSAVAAPRARSRPAKFALGAARWLGRLALTAVIAVVVTAIVLALAGAFVLSSVAERAIGESDWDLAHSDPGPFVITEAELSDGMQEALEPYTLDAISRTEADFRPPDTAILSLRVLSNPISLQGRVETQDGVPSVILERLNDVPLFIVGGIVSGGINRGFEQAWEDSRLRVASITIQQRRLTVNLELE
ncbi:MAG: serine/threonine-protein kinase, partial [Chloroflexota bacterium]|nr:serine/threonine-protein kinase [Chloroflexota bacterium]